MISTNKTMGQNLDEKKLAGLMGKVNTFKYVDSNKQPELDYSLRRQPKKTVLEAFLVPSTLLDAWRAFEVKKGELDYNTIRGYYKNIGYFLQYSSNVICGDLIEQFRFDRLTGAPEILDLGLKQVKKPTANRDAAGQYRFLEFCKSNLYLFEEFAFNFYRIKNPVDLELLTNRLTEGTSDTKKDVKGTVKVDSKKTTVKPVKPEIAAKTAAKTNIKEEHLKSVLKSNSFDLEGFKFTL